MASVWSEGDVGCSVELGSSFGVVCAFCLHSICSFSTTGWHFVSHTTLIEKAGQSREARQIPVALSCGPKFIII